MTRHTTLPGLLVSVMSAVCLWACSPQYPTVVRIKLTTVPPGGTVDRLGEPVRENHTVRFFWVVESQLAPVRYLEWVVGGLTREGFAIQQRQRLALVLTTFDGGDSYRLNLEVSGEAPTRVRVQLAVSPD